MIEISGWKQCSMTKVTDRISLLQKIVNLLARGLPWDETLRVGLALKLRLTLIDTHGCQRHAHGVPSGKLYQGDGIVMLYC